MQQARGYADTLRFDVKYVFSTNGHRYGEYDRFTELIQGPFALKWSLLQDPRHRSEVDRSGCGQCALTGSRSAPTGQCQCPCKAGRRGMGRPRSCASNSRSMLSASPSTARFSGRASHGCSWWPRRQSRCRAGRRAPGGPMVGRSCLPSFAKHIAVGSRCAVALNQLPPRRNGGGGYLFHPMGQQHWLDQHRRQ
jgi:hypothetical protein